MPHRRLLPGYPINGYLGPFVELLYKIQEAFLNSRYERNPVDYNFLLHFMLELRLVFGEVTIHQDFSTRDGRTWTAFNFIYGLFQIKLLFPRHEGRANTGLVSLYCKHDGPIDDDELDKEIRDICQAVVSTFLTSLREFYQEQRRLR